jgi:phosphoglycolate phosphatase-like HAD superfamily hydrolase
MLKIIFFDFDGVIVESADIKTEAFRELFKTYPQVDEIVKYHKQNAGVSRYEKFSYIYKSILKKPLSESLKAKLGKKFSTIVVNKIKEAPSVPGVADFLRKYSKKAMLCVASGTPEEELLNIVKSRGLSSYFYKVRGSPSKKSEIIVQVLKEEGLAKGEALFVGDSITDYNEATKVGVSFVGRTATLNPSPFPKGVTLIRDLNDLSNIMEGLLCK